MLVRDDSVPLAKPLAICTIEELALLCPGDCAGCIETFLKRLQSWQDGLLGAARGASVLRHLIGSDIYLFHSKLMMKAAHDGTFTPWHQDWGYWQFANKRPTHINAMLAIDAADRENGAIRFVDGSHKQGPVDHRHRVVP